MIESHSYLIQQVTEGKVVLLLGSGASCDATDCNGKRPPMGKELTQMLSTKFLGGKFSDHSLDEVSELAINESDLFAVQDYIREIFEPFEPTEAHQLMTAFRWEGLATTNYDRLIELAYKNNDALQVPQPLISDRDRIADLMRNPNSVKLIKLHGCITRINNPDCQMILTVDQYSQYYQGRKCLFDQLYDWARERSIVFIGHSLKDPDIRFLLQKLITEVGDFRPKYYMVSPNPDPIQVRFWERKRVTCIDATFYNFMKSLDSAVPSTFRGVKIDYSIINHPIEERFVRRESKMSKRCMQFLDVEVDYVKECANNKPIDAKQFYRGFDLGWAGIEQNLDMGRLTADEILTELVLEEPVDPSCAIISLVNAHAGAGKSILLKRIAWDAAHEYNRLCLFLKPHGTIDSVALQELQDLCQERIYLFIDDAADHTHELSQIATAPGSEFAHITVIAAERTNEWNMVNEEIKSLISSKYELHILSKKEIYKLLKLLRVHRALGTLERLNEDEQFDMFKEQAGRQILVALHEATLGKPLEEIVVDEFNNISPLEAQEMYLSICVLNRLGVRVRAGIISRIHGITFEEFKDKFFKPLEEVVDDRFDPIIRDRMYAARHPHIADMVFINVLTNQEERYDKYIRCLKSLNISYSTDSSAFRQMIRARNLMELFTNPDLIRSVLNEAQNITGRDPFVFQQTAIFEMNHDSGSLSTAGELLSKAEQLSPHSLPIKHSLAEVQLRLAERSHTTLQKEKCLSKAESISSSMIRRRSAESYPYHTICKVNLIRLEDAIAEEEEALFSSTIEKIVSSIEQTLSEGLQRFPESPHLLDAESRLADLLNDSERALSALQSAFEANRRNSWFATRISRVFQRQGKYIEASNVLKKALEANYNNNYLHYTYARLILSLDKPDSRELIFHLRRSFSPGDVNYDAQLLYGRQLYLSGEILESKKIFKDLGKARMAPEQMNRIRYPVDSKYYGTIMKQEISYLFIQGDGTTDWVFAHRVDIGDETWPSIKPSDRVSFKLGFTMKGPKAFEIAKI